MLSLQSITIRYNARTILHDISLDVQSGEILFQNKVGVTKAIL